MRLIGMLVLACWAGLACATEPALEQKQADARKQQAELRARIDVLQKEIDSQESSRRGAVQQLKESESAISEHSRRLAELADRQKAVQEDLTRIAGRITAQQGLLRERQDALGDQLRAQYASGLSPWTALLSGDDPQVIGRDLSYLGYITEAQAEAVVAVRQALDELAALRAASEARRTELGQLADEAVEQQKALEAQQAERQKVLARIEAQLKEQRGQAERLARNEQRLGELITGLEKEIARQVEAARIAEEKRRAEEARRAEQARQQALERQRELERERQRAREAEQAARAAQEAARRQQDQEAAERARIQVERARREARAAEQAEARARAPEPAPAEQSVRGSVEGTGPQASPQVPSGGFAGLRQGMPYPVSGDVLGKFGAERPEGGLWRGIVLRSPEGTAVRAIADGRVVYANWLSGFGNIMIIDHGAKYLSVYAYNQSLLKRVGDVVAGGDTVATVGATGGQVEPGLYFEIRHQGTPVNPLLWLKR